MFRQSPRRNGRNKGLKIKHVLQISVLLGVSVWLLYQLHHSDDKKPTFVKTNIIIDKAKNDTSFKLGRKDLRPKVKERNETKQELVHDHDHESEKQGEVGENERIDVGEESHEQSGVKNEKIQMGRKAENREDGGSKNEMASKEENRSEKSGQKENKKESIQVTGNEKKNKEVKVQVYKTNDDINEKVKKNKSNEQNQVVVMGKEDKEDVKEMKLNPKKPENSSLSSEEDEDEDDDQNTSRDKNGGKQRKKKSTSSGSKGPNHDDEYNKKDRAGDENQINKKESNKQQIDTNPDSNSVPSFEPKIANSTDPTDNDYDLEAQEKNELDSSTIEKDGESILDEEKDALTDLGTLPESETGGSISHDDAATE